MPRFVLREDGGSPVLHIDTHAGEEFTSEQAVIWMLNEIRVQLASVDRRLMHIEANLSNIYTAMPG